MAKARKAKEISFTMPNKAGLLSEVSRAISGASVNITAICAYAMGDTAYFMLTTASNVKAKKTLEPWSVAIEERDVVEVELLNRPGELQRLPKGSPMLALILSICTQRLERVNPQPVFLRRPMI